MSYVRLLSNSAAALCIARRLLYDYKQREQQRDTNNKQGREQHEESNRKTTTKVNEIVTVWSRGLGVVGCNSLLATFFMYPVLDGV